MMTFFSAFVAEFARRVFSAALDIMWQMLGALRAPAGFARAA